MRGLFYNHTGRASGAERVLILALEHLDRTLVDPQVVCPAGDLADAVKGLGIPVRHIGELNARFTLSPRKLAVYAISFFRTVSALRSEIKTAKADIVHANSPRGGIAAFFATVGTNLPVVWHVHDEFTPHPITSLIRLLALLCRRCRFIAVSEATARSFTGLSGAVNRRVQVIHNAVDLTAIDAEAPFESIRSELGIKQDDFLFGIVGQITPRKGQLELVEAFAKIAADMPSAKLLVIGAPMFDHDNDYRQQVATLAANLALQDRIIFMGHRPDAINVIKQLDSLVINSKSEAFVMVGLEAMACRTPVVATDVGGTREMIKDRYNGLLIPWEDDTALTGALIKMYEDKELRELFGTRSRERVEKEFNVGRFARDFYQALTHAAAKREADAAPVQTHALEKS